MGSPFWFGVCCVSMMMNLLFLVVTGNMIFLLIAGIGMIGVAIGPGDSRGR